jgi:hypothetical protein
MVSSSFRHARRKATATRRNRAKRGLLGGKFMLKGGNLLGETGCGRVGVKDGIGEVAAEGADQRQPVAGDRPMAATNVLGCALGAADLLRQHLGRHRSDERREASRQNLRIVPHEEVAPIGHGWVTKTGATTWRAARY